MPKSPPDLVQHNCLTYAYSGLQNEWRFARRGRDYTVKITGNLHGNNGDIICNAAAAGLGVVVQPTFLVYELLRAKKLVRILEGWELDVLTIYAIYPNRQFLPPKVRSFIDFLVEHFGPNPYWDKDIE
jgi:DNA-binding transcriptional LysR family regulator